MADDADLYWNIKLAAGAAVLGLNLNGIDRRVYSQLIPGDVSGYSFDKGEVLDISFPCVLFTSEGETEEMGRGDSEGIGGVFPQRCWIVDNVDPGMHAKERIYLAARRRTMRLFSQTKLADRPEVIQCNVTPYVMFDARLHQYQKIVSGFVIRFEWGIKRY